MTSSGSSMVFVPPSASLVAAAVGGDERARLEVVDWIDRSLRSEVWTGPGRGTRVPAIYDAFFGGCEPDAACRSMFLGAAVDAIRRLLFEGDRRCRVGSRVLESTFGSPVEPAEADRVLGSLERTDRTAFDVYATVAILGLGREAASRCLEMSEAQVQSNYAYARAWLRSALEAR